MISKKSNAGAKHKFNSDIEVERLQINVLVPKKLVKEIKFKVNQLINQIIYENNEN